MSVYLYFCVSVYMSVYLCLYVFLCLYISVSLSLSGSLCVYECMTVSVSTYVNESLCNLSVCVCLCVCPYVWGGPRQALGQDLKVSLSISYPIHCFCHSGRTQHARHIGEAWYTEVGCRKMWSEGQHLPAAMHRRRWPSWGCTCTLPACRTVSGLAGLRVWAWGWHIAAGQCLQGF